MVVVVVFVAVLLCCLDVQAFPECSTWCDQALQNNSSFTLKSFQWICWLSVEEILINLGVVNNSTQVIETLLNAQRTRNRDEGSDLELANAQIKSHYHSCPHVLKRKLSINIEPNSMPQCT